MPLMSTNKTAKEEGYHWDCSVKVTSNAKDDKESRLSTQTRKKMSMIEMLTLISRRGGDVEIEREAKHKLARISAQIPPLSEFEN